MSFQVQEAQLPEPSVVRARIDATPRTDIRMALRMAYLYAGRISEVVGHSSPGDNTTARGPRGSDARIEKVVIGPVEEEAAVFSVRTAKRSGKLRYVALPLSYEPWAKEALDYYQKAGGELVFPFTRQLVGEKAREYMVFSGLQYQVEGYNIWADGKVTKKVLSHPTDFVVHAIRHVRPSELVNVYGFDGVDLAAYGGWTLKSAVGVGSLDRYLSLSWQRYFPKLLKRVVP